MSFTLDFTKINMDNISQVGGKNASLGEMITRLSKLNVKIPKGFAVTTEAYKSFLQENELGNKMYSALENLNVDNVEDLKNVSTNIQTLILNSKFSELFKDEIAKAYQQLNLTNEQSVAVRSSATAEDLESASFAGQQETYLNILGLDEVLQAVKKVYASLFTKRAIAYRVHNNFDHRQVAISVGIQQMIRSDVGASGVIFTMDTESGFDQVIFITASYGLGETIVKGAVNPDEFYVHKPTLQSGKKSIVSRKLGSKKIKMVYKKNNNTGVVTTEVNDHERNQFCLTDQEILELSRQSMVIESHYGKAMDIEWAKDGIDQQLYVVQARPETVKVRENKQLVEQYYLVGKSKPITSGRSIGQKVGQGMARLVKIPQEMNILKEGEVLVTDMTDPDWEPVMKRATAIVTNRGGRTCHAAIVAREMGIPAVVGCGNATQTISDGSEITVSCAEGETGFVYPGLIEYQVERTEIEKMPDLSVKFCMNLANPEQAFIQQFLPNDGVGLARLEFIISNMIGVHPNALLHFETLTDEIKNTIRAITSAYKTPVEFYIEKIAEGVATIAAAFYPKPIIVRFSDFKSNEYANLLGGHPFEPKEENPMLGYRGASRYLSGNFKDCFKLECEAIKRVRDQKGLTNCHVMFPFVRTVDEAKKLIQITKSYGLERGQNGLKMYMMCEIPSNILLAEEFLQYFDGYSIGSNDLTQLTLGLDRDSELIADLFDEENAAIKLLLEKVIATCVKMNKYIGICGQGPSDSIDFAKWLMAQGVHSLSLTPDAIVKTWLALKK